MIVRVVQGEHHAATVGESHLGFASLVVVRSTEGSDMHPSRLATLSSATVLLLVLSASDAFAGNEACKILTAEKFSEIMGYTAKISVSSEAMCGYKGAGDAGGMLMIITEEATLQMLAMLNGQGSVPHGNAGKLGASFSKGTVLFSVGITGTDPSKVIALAAEVKRNLK
jgi:PPE-repeat protein